MAVTNKFNFLLLNGSDAAGHNTINNLINSIESSLEGVSTGLATGADTPGALTTGQVLRWNGSTYAAALVNAASLDTSAVTESKIADNAVTSAKINNLAVTTNKIADDAVTLGTKTSGNYIATISGTINQIDVSGSGSESSAVTISIPSNPTLPGQPTVGTAVGAYPVTGNDSRIATVKYVNDAAASITAGTSFTVGGDLSGTTGNATIVSGAVTSDKILNNTITLGDLATALQALLVPTGTIAPFAGLSGSKPSGWFICDGSSFASNGLSSGNALYDLLVAAGWTTLPDLRGRTIVGSGTGAGLTLRTLRDNYGAETAALVSNNLPAHTHSVSETSTGGTAYASIVNNTNFAAGSGIGQRAIVNTSQAGGLSGYEGLSSFGTSPNHTHSVSVSGGGNGTSTGNAFQISQPTLVLNYIIKG